LNPDFFLRDSTGLKEVLEWLKVCALSQFTIMIFICVQKINPHPQGLIDLWEDYNFIIQCDRSFRRNPSYKAAKESHNFSEILSQASPQLIRILQAYKLDCAYHNCDFLLDIRLMLNLPWDELRRAICPLREIIGDVEGGIKDLLYFTPNPAPPRTPQCRSMFWDIAFGYLPILMAVHAGKLPVQLRQVSFDVYDMRLISFLGLGIIGTGCGVAL
jgi:hypothetical protein